MQNIKQKNLHGTLNCVVIQNSTHRFWLKTAQERALACKTEQNRFTIWHHKCKRLELIRQIIILYFWHFIFQFRQSWTQGLSKFALLVLLHTLQMWIQLHTNIRFRLVWLKRQRRSNIVLTVEIFSRNILATRKLVLATKSENLGATWPQGFHLKVEPWRYDVEN